MNRSVTRARCAIGEPPDYEVPHEEDLGPAVLVVCAMLPLSGERVEFSVSRARLNGAVENCLHAAYSGGDFIRTSCALEPSLGRYSVRGIGEARRAWGEYRYVIWGTAGGPVSAVQLRHGAWWADATVISPSRAIARRLGQENIKIWIVELPLAAACKRVVINPYYGRPDQHLRPQRGKCERAFD